VFRWIVQAVLLILLCALLGGGLLFAQRERQCVWTNRCEDRLRSLNVQLEFYSADQLMELEQRAKKKSARRAFYPATLGDLSAGDYVSPENLECPVYGLPYVYVQRNDGKSYLAYCPARHYFHFSTVAFDPAITDDRIGLHLVVKDGQVVNLAGGHSDPWDFGNPAFKEDPTTIPASLVKMVGQNPAPLTSW